MSTSARAGRRRRLLHEGAGERDAVSSPETAASTHARYTPRAGSASFAFASSVAPTSAIGLSGIVVVLSAVTATLAWADGFGVALATADRLPSVARLLMIDQPASLAAWWTSGLWAAVAALAVLLFGLRRQRTDDLGGGYRWWLFAACVAMLLSANAATRVGGAVAETGKALSGFAPLGSGAVWWLAPIGLVVLGLAARMLMELRESFVATAAAVLAVAAGAVSIALQAGAAEQLASVTPWLAVPVAGPVATMTAASLTLVALLAYTRRIVREAEGVVAPPIRVSTTKNEETPSEKASAKRTTRRAAAKKAAAKPDAVAKPRVVRPEPEPEPVKATESKETQESTWVDGGEGYQDDYEEGGPRRRLSKAERKRLRKLKARRAA